MRTYVPTRKPGERRGRPLGGSNTCAVEISAERRQVTHLRAAGLTITEIVAVTGITRGRVRHRLYAPGPGSPISRA